VHRDPVHPRMSRSEVWTVFPPEPSHAPLRCNARPATSARDLTLLLCRRHSRHLYLHEELFRPFCTLDPAAYPVPLHMCGDAASPTHADVDTNPRAGSPLRSVRPFTASSLRSTASTLERKGFPFLFQRESGTYGK